MTAAPLTVLLGSVASYMYLVLPALSLLLPWWLWRHPEETRIGMLVVTLWVITILLVPIPAWHDWLPLLGLFIMPLVALALFGAIYYLIQQVSKGSLKDKPPVLFAASIPLLWYGGAVLGFVLVPTLEHPWVPAEVLALRSAGVFNDLHPDNQPLRSTRYPVVYVLSDSNGWTTALTAETRRLIQIPSSSIGARAVCHHPSQLPGSATLWQRIQGQDYNSGNLLCARLVIRHKSLLDPQVPPDATPASQGATPSRTATPQSQ